MFLVGTSLFLEIGEPAFLLYSGAYLTIGIFAMLVTAWLNKKK